MTRMTYGDLRSNAEKIADEEIKTRVLAGIDVLNRFDPNWADYIDPGELILSDARRCVLGQVFTDKMPSEAQVEEFHATCPDWEFIDLENMRYQPYWAGLAILDGDVMRDPSAFGFDSWDGEGAMYEQLTAGWKTVFGIEGVSVIVNADSEDDE